MKDFLLIYRGGDATWRERATKAEVAAVMEKWGAWFGGLQKTDQLVAGGSPLHPGGKRVGKSGSVVTDIAASELKELVSGYSIIRAKDLEGAVAVAKGCPIFRMEGAVVEVREVMEM